MTSSKTSQILLIVNPARYEQSAESESSSYESEDGMPSVNVVGEVLFYKSAVNAGSWATGL
jgi:hypothetical protein